MNFKLILAILYCVPGLACAQSDSLSMQNISGLVQPFIGTWEEYTITGDDEVYLGTLESELTFDDQVISQRFMSRDSTFSYLSFGYIHPSSGILEETFVFSNGSISEYQWLTHGNEILLRRTGGTRALDHMQQLRFTNIRADQYDVVEEYSYDRGKTWKFIELTVIRRTN